MKHAEANCGYLTFIKIYFLPVFNWSNAPNFGDAIGTGIFSIYVD